MRKKNRYQGNIHNSLKTHCSNGHEYTIENTQIKSNGQRRCRQCRRMYSRQRRERLQRLEGSYSSTDETVTRNKFNHKCFICGDREDLTIDHHIPISRGGSLSLNNAVLLCRRCNSAKNSKSPEDFYDSDQLEHLKALLV
jgi:5-methylcytosine-specific restriction endonuclease McrA